jgi:hypothetical protein
MKIIKMMAVALCLTFAFSCFNTYNTYNASAEEIYDGYPLKIA